MAGPIRFTDIVQQDDWRHRSACIGRDPRLWDAEATDGQHGRAKAVCRRVCPVRRDCADDVDVRLDEGVRGGHVLPRLHAGLENQGSARDNELLRLLRRGVPLDIAAPRADRFARRPGRPPKEKTA